MNKPIFDANEYLKVMRDHMKSMRFGASYAFICPRAVLEDGFELSIQASKNHYCSPRIDDADEYSSFEIGYPSEEVKSLKEYAENGSESCSVYTFVPVEIVNKILEDHGGIVGSCHYDYFY